MEGYDIISDAENIGHKPHGEKANETLRETEVQEKDKQVQEEAKVSNRIRRQRAS